MTPYIYFHRFTSLQGQLATTVLNCVCFMGNKASATFPTYEIARSHLNAKEVLQIKESFKRLCRNQETNQLSLSNFLLSLNSPSSYVRKHILPKLFHVMDIKKDGHIDLEEYTCVIVLCRIGSLEEKYKLLFSMYESVKGSSLLPRESLRQMLIDATIFEGRTDIPVGQLEQWLIDQKELANGMVDAAINQFGSQDNELSIKEFYLFVKTEGTLQYLLRCLIEFIDPS